MKRIILFGAPGAGKGSVAEYLEKELGYKQISTGDLIRAEVKAGTELGLRVKLIQEQGRLIADDVIITMVGNRVAAPDLGGGYVLDGFPRTIAQAEALVAVKADREVVVFLDVKVDEVVRRMLSRLVCSQCGTIYNSVSHPPRIAGICDQCQGVVQRRADDTEETVSKRLAIYLKETMPVIEFYRHKGILRSIDGGRDVATVCESVRQVVS
jgi:adenylate kinase